MSNQNPILIPESAVPPVVFSDHQQRVREVILRNLANLAEDLGQFEQTCHGVLGLGERPWEQLGRQIGLVGQEPTAFNISTLASEITLILKKCKWEEKPKVEPQILKVHEIVERDRDGGISQAVILCSELARMAINRLEHETVNRTGYHMRRFSLEPNSSCIELKMEMTNQPWDTWVQLADGTNVKIDTRHLEPTGTPILRHPETGDVIPNGCAIESGG